MGRERSKWGAGVLLEKYRPSLNGISWGTRGLLKPTRNQKLKSEDEKIVFFLLESPPPLKHGRKEQPESPEGRAGAARSSRQGLKGAHKGCFSGQNCHCLPASRSGGAAVLGLFVAICL